MSLRPMRSMRSIPSLKRALHSSSTAPNPSHLLSSQQDTVRTHFTSLTVSALKSECRDRGLKLAGRKVDLIDRIVGYEQAKTFSTSAATEASPIITETVKFPKPVPRSQEFSTSAAVENPESIDSYTVPPPKLKEFKDHPVSKIPVAPDSQGISVELQSEDKLNDTGASAGDVHVVDDNSNVSTMNVDLGDGAPKHEEERSNYRPTNSLPSSDKTFLWGLGGIIAAWWSSQWIGKSTEEKAHS